MIEKLNIRIKYPNVDFYILHDYWGYDNLYILNPDNPTSIGEIASYVTGWFIPNVFKDSPKYWILNGVGVPPMEVFESLTDEEKEEAIWEIDEWI